MALHLALGIDTSGKRDILGMWILDQEGASHWLKIFNDLRSRGVSDIFIAVTDGLAGMTKAIEEVFPRTIHQTCIVHLIRSSTAFLSYKDRSGVLPLFKKIYTAPTAEATEAALIRLRRCEINKKYPFVANAWRRVWDKVIPFFDYPPEIRKLIYTTNSIESLNRGIRKVIKTRTVFPHVEAAEKTCVASHEDYCCKMVTTEPLLVQSYGTI